MPTYTIDPLYPHWFRCDLCGQDVGEVLPAEALDLVNLTPAQVLELCPDAEAEIDGHEHDCPAVALTANPAFSEASVMSSTAATAGELGVRRGRGTAR